ncbi:MAG: glutamate 5-kinase [Armatimonadota bacterium]|nr:glutamate 5-kinase [Armatimonadota bacterium]
MRVNERQVRRIVVKVGTSSLVSERGSLDREKMANLVDQLAEIKRRGIEVVLVTSGAIRAGMERLGIQRRPRNIPDQQASAAVGQSLLMNTYTELFTKHNIIPAQVLLTRDDFRDRVRYLNLRNTMHTLFRFGCLPIVNENDTVAIEEIRFEENDTLSALVAASIDADLLLNLSDVEGLYEEDPRKNRKAKLLEEIREITPEIEALAGATGTDYGRGGMRAKIEAAKIATSSGVTMIIARSTKPHVIIDAVEGKNVGTRFVGESLGLSHRKRWIAFGNRIKGRIIINEGAKRMLRERGKSLLAAGIIGCEGSFDVGDLVAIVDEKGEQVGRGFANYSSCEIEQIKGKRSSEIEKILGHKDFDEVVHRDNLVLGV